MSSMFSEGAPLAHFLPSNTNPVLGLLGGHHNNPGSIAPSPHHGEVGLGQAVAAMAQHHSDLASIIHSLIGGGHVPPPMMEGYHPVGRVDPGAQGFTRGGGPLAEGLPSLPAPAPMGNDRAGDITHMPGYAQQTGNAQLWEQRHPYATQHGNIPSWVMQSLMAALQNARPMQPPPSSQYQ